MYTCTVDTPNQCGPPTLDMTGSITMHDATRASANVALNVKFMSSTRDQVHNRTGKALETNTSRVPDDETSAPAAWFREMSHTMTRIVGLTGSVTTYWDVYSAAICCEIRKVRRKLLLKGAYM